MAHSAGPEQVYIALISWLKDLASAFDAADRGYHDEAERIQTEAFAGIRALLDEYGFVDRELPDLRRHLDADNPFFDTAEFTERAQARVQAIRAGVDNG